ncbi:MAG: trehalose-phosphatase [Dehalococcoidia bacterium]|nr:trehalose-phosphatase [Dehalococcoidia bacterium]
MDGTLSELVSNPEDSEVSPHIRDPLQELCGKLHLVAVITGRSALQARRIVAIDDLLYVGNHGLEQLRNGELSVPVGVQPHLQPLNDLKLVLQSELAIPGVSFEDKGVSFAIHYRNAPDPEAAGLQVQEAIDREGGGAFRLVPGKMVINILPPVHLTKGTAVHDLAEGHGLEAAMYIGDDLTDLDAFRAVDDLVNDGRCEGLKIGVVGADAPREIADEADYTLGSVGEVGWFLDWLSANAG